MLEGNKAPRLRARAPVSHAQLGGRRMRRIYLRKLIAHLDPQIRVAEQPKRCQTPITLMDDIGARLDDERLISKSIPQDHERKSRMLVGDKTNWRRSQYFRTCVDCVSKSYVLGRLQKHGRL